MVCAELQRVLLEGRQEWRIASAKRSDKSSTILQDGRFANAQETRFQGAKLWNMSSAVQQWG